MPIKDDHNTVKTRGLCMTRRSRGSRERADRQVLPLKLALYHELHDMPGGVPVMAVTYRIGERSLMNNLNPNSHDRAPSLRQFEQILEYTRASGRGQRIIDSLAQAGNFVWMERPGVSGSNESIMKGIDQLVKRVGMMVSTVTDAVEDGEVDQDELASLEKDLIRLFQAGFGLIEAAKRVG